MTVLGLVVPRRSVDAGPLLPLVGHRSWTPVRSTVLDLVELGSVLVYPHVLAPWQVKVIKEQWLAMPRVRRDLGVLDPPIALALDRFIGRTRIARAYRVPAELIGRRA